MKELLDRIEHRKRLSEGYEEFKKDPIFFDERRDGGKYVATRMDPKKGIAYSVIKKSDAAKIRKHKGYGAHPDGWLSVYFVPAPYATKNKMAIDEVKRGMFEPVWDWGTGPRKGGWG